jgi:tripartite-type tricarboxylate transporter receptor subunit TctC
MSARASTFAFLCAALAAGTVCAQRYPMKPVRLLASGVGGAGDFTARVVALGLTSRLGQQVIVDNRPGGLVPGEIVAKAQPDGHTLMLVGIVIWLSPFMRDSMPFDPVRDFAPITLAAQVPNVLVVNLALPVKSVQELIALTKEKPGVLNYATSGTGNSNHIAGELFKAMAGVNLVQVNYKGAALALNDVVSGRVEVMFATATAAAPHINAGRLRALAVTTERPSAVLPGLPTVAASGLPGYASESTLGLFAPAATPRTIVTRLNAETLAVLNAAETRNRLLKSGIEVVTSSPAEFAAAIKADMARSGKIIRAAGIRTD